MNFSEKEILAEIDSAFIGEPGPFFPGKKNQKDIHYNFFLDLEHGYCNTASSRIHLYADEENWAVVFEKGGYQNRAPSVEVELYYVGNCIEYIL
ncbi:MAG: hypothetical protein AAFZ63_27685, partial [Bacteroidota bacterium]